MFRGERHSPDRASDTRSSQLPHQYEHTAVFLEIKISAQNNQRPRTRQRAFCWCAKPRRLGFRCRCRDGQSALRSAQLHDSSPSVFAQQRRHGPSCYEPGSGARDQARTKATTFFAWKQAASQISFTISNEIGVFRHQLYP